jgi:dolichyl-phosphate beta-glucosyltransferase
MREHPHVRELVLVDDGSRDGTAALIRRFESELPNVRGVSYFPNGGKGYAIRRGVLEASAGMAVLVTDADLSTPIEDLPILIRALETHDVAIGSRALATSDVGVRQRWYRQLMGKTFNRVMRAITGVPFIDTQCGFKLFSARSAKLVFAEAAVDRFAYDVEALVIASRLGFSVAEVPVRWNNDTDSKVRILRDSFRMLLDVIRIRLRLGPYRR